MLGTPSTDVLHLRWQPEESDLGEAYSARNKANNAWAKLAVLALLTGGFGVAALASGVPGIGVACLVMAVCLLFIGPVLQRVSCRGLWRLRTDWHVPLHVVVDPNVGLTIDGPDPAVHEWQTLRGVLETERLFVVRLSGHGSEADLLLAKRGLADQQDVERLRGLLIR